MRAWQSPSSSVQRFHSPQSYSGMPATVITRVVGVVIPLWDGVGMGVGVAGGCHGTLIAHPALRSCLDQFGDIALPVS